jgi:hypothetical protein
MAEPIAAVVLASPSRKSVRLHTYVSTEKAGQAKGERFVAQSGLNGCIPEFAERQFRDNRKRWGKNADRTVERGGRKFVEGQYVQAYHLIQSFARDGRGYMSPGRPADWERAHELGLALARRVAGKGRMATVTTQIDGKTGCLHNHIVIDSVDRFTGRSFDSSAVKHKLLAKAHDEVLLEAGYRQVNTLDKGAEKVEKSELRAAARHAEWQADPTSSAEPFSVAVLKQRVRDSMGSADVVDWDTFVARCEQNGVEVRRSTARDGRGISYRMLRQDGTDRGGWLPGSPGDVRRAAKLGTGFTMDAVEEALQRNIQAHQIQPQATTAQPTNGPTTPVPDRSEKTTPDAAALGMVGTDDSSKESTSYAAAPDMPSPDSKPDPLAEMWAEREANTERDIARMKAELGLGQTLEQIDAQEAAEAAQAASEPVVVTEAGGQVSEPVGREEPTSSASAPDIGAPADAPLSQAANGEFKSLLRDVRVRDQKRQQLIDDMAVFDERAVAALEAGGMFAEADVPKGVGRKFLDVYGERIDPEVLFVLDQRETKKEAATALWEKALGKTHVVAQADREKARKIRDGVRAGDYSLDDLKPDYKTQAERNLVERQAGDDERSL